MSGPTLLVVDVQRGFVNTHTAHIPALVEAAQGDYQSIFATRFYNPEGSPFRTIMGWTRFAPGSADTELAFAPAPHVEVIEKPTYTCVTDGFVAKLRALETSEVHVCGIDTDVCVTTCAVDLFERGIRPVVLSRLCASHGGHDLHEAALRILKRDIGANQVQ